MSFETPVNVNYCGTIMAVKAIVPLENCTNIQGAILSTYHVVVDKNVKEGDIGVFFPVEVQFDNQYLFENNLYRKPELNKDNTKKGYLEENRRLRCVKLRGHRSEGIFMPLSSLAYTGVNIDDFKVGDEFDKLNGISICKKYFIERPKNSSPSDKKKDKIARVSRMIPGQFALHIDTAQLKKNAHVLTPDTLVSISYKMHGTSVVIGKVLVKRQLTLRDKIAKMFGVKVVEQEYDLVYASRNVIKNEHFHKGGEHFYSTNVWQEAAERAKDVIPEGITLYGEIVGYVAENSFVQKGFHYGQENGTHKLYIYRITNTNAVGKVFELTRPEIDEFCKYAGLTPTPLFFYGRAKDIYPDLPIDDFWSENLIARMDTDEKFMMNNVMCPMNNNEVPAEGCVLRIERMYDPTPYKLKNFKFLEWESKQLDKGEIDLESLTAEDEPADEETV